MKRDMELVRQILIALDAHPHGFAPSPLTLPEYDEETIGYHLWLMEQGGLITAEDVSAQGSPSPVALPWGRHMARSRFP